MTDAYLYFDQSLSHRDTTIYGLVSSDEPDTVRYVGKTVKSVDTRLASHRYYARSGADFPVHRWIRQLISEDKYPIAIVLETVPGSLNWELTEQVWIAKMRVVHGKRLLNIADGGDGILGSSLHSAEIRKKISEKLHSPEVHAKLMAASARQVRTAVGLIAHAKARRGTHLSKETREKIGAKSLGRKHTEETRKKMSVHALNRAVNPRTFLGRHHSDETKKVLSEKVKAYYGNLKANGVKIIRVISEEQRRQISATLKARHAARRLQQELST